MMIFYKVYFCHRVINYLSIKEKYEFDINGDSYILRHESTDGGEELIDTEYLGYNADHSNELI